ncbi:MAG: hypothetical protein ACR2JQ_01605 [Mycobacteriales bacterium]
MRPIRAAVNAWTITLIVVYGLYTVIPVLFFNDGNRRIAGMPSMLFWFSLLPWLIPGIMYVLYVVDDRLMTRLADERAPDRGDAGDTAAGTIAGGAR